MLRPRLDDFFTPDFGCLYRERYFCSYSFRSFFMSRFGFGISGLYKSELVIFLVFGCLYRERYCFFVFFYLVLLCLMSRFGFGISGLYKSEPTFFFVFGCLYRERYFCSYSLISSCFASSLCVEMRTKSQSS